MRSGGGIVWAILYLRGGEDKRGKKSSLALAFCAFSPHHRPSQPSGLNRIEEGVKLPKKILPVGQWYVMIR